MLNRNFPDFLMRFINFIFNARTWRSATNRFDVHVKHDDGKEEGGKT